MIDFITILNACECITDMDPAMYCMESKQKYPYSKSMICFIDMLD